MKALHTNASMKAPKNAAAAAKANKKAIKEAIAEAPANPALEAATKSNEKPKRVVKPASRKAKTAELEARIEGPKDEVVPVAGGVIVREPAKRPESWVLSTAEKPTKKVWAIADSMPGASRKEVIAACVAQGIAPGTSRTQYQAWFKAMRDSGKPVR